MDIKTLALVSIIGRGISLTFIILVLIRQVRLFRTFIEPHLRNFRRIPFYLSLVVLAGNIAPVIIDTLTMFVDIGRQPKVGAAGVVYSLSYCFTSAISAYMIWVLYSMAARIAAQQERTDKLRHNN